MASDRTEMQIARVTHYNYIMRTTIFTLLGVAAVAELGDVGLSLPLILLTIGAAAYGILAGNVAQDDIMALHDDMDAEMKDSAYGRCVHARDIHSLKRASSITLGAIALATILSIAI